MHNLILEKIQEFDVITIFRHQAPDMDAFGSQLGLKYSILERYPDKKVYALGDSGSRDEFNMYLDEVEDEIVHQSLAIVLDTANSPRVDDERFKNAAYSIRIDHHVQVETLCDYEWIEPKASATCEMLALLFKEWDWKLPQIGAQFLYCGLTADNCRFSIASVREESFEAGAYLFANGVDVVKATEMNFASTYNDFCYETIVKQKSIRVGNALTAILENEDYEAVGFNFVQAKEKVYALGGIRDIQVWALFTKMEDREHYSASLRAKTKDVRSIAEKFGGGGHVCAAGIKNLTREQVDEIIELLEKRSLEA
ncbi:MAG: bifunctional oligoribonuclease/PAP phosphatase NrnA [Bacillota bacterium]|nr:bifunctional oligoribonuclease/PAP phosphatase NrnA [Bacillota bacterium]